MSYEMMKLVHLTCSKDHVQSPKIKEGWDLLWRTSDDSSSFTLINIHKDEPEAPRVRDIMTEERASKEYKRAVDPPQELNITLGTRDNSRWIKVWWEL